MMQQKTAFIFPGQGSQFIGMGKDLAENFPSAKLVFQEIDDILHQNLSHIAWQADIKELTQTQNAQPAIMAVSMAIIRTLESQGFSLKENICLLAGHSLGEYTALCAGKSISIKQAAQILKVRGQAMAQASQKDPCGMMAILGLTPDQVKQIATDSDCFVANDNGANQWVLSGKITTLATAKMRAESMGAKRVIPLPVAGAFHSPLMRDAQEKITSLLKEITFQQPIIPVVMNVSAEAEQDPHKLGNLLIQQIVSPVRWRESILYMKQQGVERFVECGPGSVLSGLVRRILPNVHVEHISDTSSLQAFMEALKK